MIKCKQCGQLVDDSAAFCPRCGSRIERFGNMNTPPNPGQTPPHNNDGYYQQAHNYNQNYGQQQYQQRQQYQQYRQQQYQQQNQGYSKAPNGMKARNIDMIEACKMYWVKYAEFTGRSRRAEYWWAALMTFVIGCVLGWTIIASLACIIPSIAVGVRRLHDIGKSGWFILLSLIPLAGQIVLIVWFCQEGTIGRNEYGEDPKYIA